MHPTPRRERGVSLCDLFPDGHICGGSDIRVQSCCSHSDACQPGDLFVALAGENDDGHDAVDEAVRRGATAVLAERLLPVDVPVCIVPDSRVAFGRLCQELAGQPSDKLYTVGITGTAGKSSTAHLLGSILESAGCSLGLVSDLGCSDGRDSSSGYRGAFTPAEYAHWMSRMVRNGAGYAVLEMSSQSLAQHHTAGISLDAAVLTNIRRAHLDLHNSIRNYHQAKLRLLQQLKPHGLVIANADDPVSSRLLKSARQPVLSFGLHQPAPVTARILERHLGEQTFLLMAASEAVPVRTRMIGDHHIYNCLAAAAVALMLGIDLATTARGLERLEFIPGRLERLDCGQPFGVFVDCAQTVDALVAAVNTLKRVTPGRLICVLGAGDDVPHEERPLLGRMIERTAQRIVLTGGGQESSQPLRNAHDILDGFQRPAAAHVLPNRSRAIAWALSQAKPGDSVLITGAPPERYETRSPGRQRRDEGLLARKWLYVNAGEAGPGAERLPLRVVRGAR